MSVYVDRLRSAPGRLGKKRWCKMWADTIEERAEMANKLRIPMSDLQTVASVTHYEITPGQRLIALAHKALIYTVREWKYDQKRKENKR